MITIKYQKPRRKFDLNQENDSLKYNIEGLHRRYNILFSEAL
jgi:hypothetical protein